MVCSNLRAMLDVGWVKKSFDTVMSDEWKNAAKEEVRNFQSTLTFTHLYLHHLEVLHKHLSSASPCVLSSLPSCRPHAFGQRMPHPLKAQLTHESNEGVASLTPRSNCCAEEDSVWYVRGMRRDRAHPGWSRCHAPL